MSFIAPDTQPPAQETGAAQPPPRQPRPPWSQFRGTFGLIALTVVIFAAQWVIASVTGTKLLLAWGAKSKPEILQGQLWRFVTPIFLHVNLLHIFVNMYSLYAIGPAVERFFGTPRFLAVYLLSGISGVIFSVAFSPYPSAGASGSIFGLLGALAAFLYLHRELFGRFGRLQLRQLIIVALLNLGLGLMPGIDNWGHLGGLLAGVALTWFVGPSLRVVQTAPGEGRLVDQRPWTSVGVSILIAVGVLSAMAYGALALPPGS
jgi:membrane associated rhomboid family serine protease